MVFPRSKPPTSCDLLRCLGDMCVPALEEAVAECDADRYVKQYGTVGFALSLIAYHILGLRSLRELHARLDYDSHLTGVVGWSGISVSQLLKLPHMRPTEIWAPLVTELSKRVTATHGSGNTRVVDTSFYTMGLKLMQRHHPNKKMNHTATAGFKLGAVLDPDSGVPLHFISAVGQGTDTAHIATLAPPDQAVAGQLFLFDRGFRNYKFFDRLIEDGAHFITRSTRQTRYDVIENRGLDAAHPEVLTDQIVHLGTPKSRPRMTHLTRRIELKAQRKTFVFLTSDLERDAWDICEDYRVRWTIEPFFRWFKSGIGCVRPLGYTQQAAEHTFWAALVAYLLILLLAQRVESPTTGRMTFRIKSTVHRVRAMLHEPVSRGDLEALGFL